MSICQLYWGSVQKYFATFTRNILRSFEAKYGGKTTTGRILLFMVKVNVERPKFFLWKKQHNAREKEKRHTIVFSGANRMFHSNEQDWGANRTLRSGGLCSKKRKTVVAGEKARVIGALHLGQKEQVQKEQRKSKIQQLLTFSGLARHSKPIILGLQRGKIQNTQPGINPQVRIEVWQSFWKREVAGLEDSAIQRLQRAGKLWWPERDREERGSSRHSRRTSTAIPGLS